ncbi:MAG: SCO1664 family protein [Anaerolineales bacterium]|nr:SCO1664 family protein [Anaerolineales bacterium]
MVTNRAAKSAETVTASQPDVLTTLRAGELTLRGLFSAGSNYTFLAEVVLRERCIQAVYQPTTGEQPLWDFPSGTLAKREVAAYLVSHALGWELVPPTVYRDGPHGPGSLQQFIEFQPGGHYFNFTGTEKAACRRVAAFDYVINNADRKSSHVMRGPDGRMWLIDHGICFHSEYKMRTVIWDYAGELLPDGLGTDLENLADDVRAGGVLADSLRHLLSEDEIGALRLRTRTLVLSGSLPRPVQQHNYPWPQM